MTRSILSHLFLSLLWVWGVQAMIDSLEEKFLAVPSAASAREYKKDSQNYPWPRYDHDSDDDDDDANTLSILYLS